MRRIEALKEPNRSYALQFKDWMELQNRATRTIAKRLDELIFVLKELGTKDAKEATKADIGHIVIAINNAKRKDGKGIATISKGKIKMTMRKFYKFLLNSKTYPEIVEDVRPDRAKNALLPTDMLSEADVDKLTRMCRNPRDKALLSLLMERYASRRAACPQNAGCENGRRRGRCDCSRKDRPKDSIFDESYISHHLHATDA